MHQLNQRSYCLQNPSPEAQVQTAKSKNDRKLFKKWRDFDKITVFKRGQTLVRDFELKRIEKRSRVI